MSISRGRERVHVFTDDADLLARRVTDSHTRKAAVELQGLRDGLAKLGFIRKEQLKEKAAPPMEEDFPKVAVRKHRQTRLSTIQRLATLVENVRQQIEVLAHGQDEAVSEKIGPAESVKQNETARRVREGFQQRHAHRQQQRRSGGIHI